MELRRRLEGVEWRIPIILTTSQLIGHHSLPRAAGVTITGDSSHSQHRSTFLDVSARQM